MKRRFPVVVVAMLACVTMLQGQDYKRLRVALGGGLALPQGNRGRPGWVASIEPGFRVTNNLLMGIKMESGMYSRGMSRNVTVVNPTTQLISGTVFTQLYLSSNYVRPFLCGGFGYSLMSDEKLQVTFDGSTETVMIGEDVLHFMIRSGIEVWHVSISAEIAFSGDEKPTDFLEIKNNILSFRFLLLIGGGLR